ncbi:transposase [Xenococcus sp. PCC 7305]|uniref:transposase n=1 Tax=Xenococcus sp. PCC 7305 TaxID=102125 RepID=UPI0002ACB096|nr:transposase [Xenococcus sp. PCC 7305]ELS03668.1 transposase [Xenococcus sp. PCC 7305]
MPRQPRNLKSNYCYHVTVRCNNREFKLIQPDCREVFLYSLKKSKEKFNFKLYALCIMSNHVHYLLEPKQPEDLPRIMHWLNWYTAMCFNRMLNRTGHFWEKRYHSSGFENTDYQRALNTLRYIHANPKAANMQQGFFYDFSNYGVHDRLGDDGITQWHPAFLSLGKSLDECAAKYRKFCRRYKPKPKSENRYHWGSKLLPKVLKARGKKKRSPGQLSLPWNDWEKNSSEIREVAEKFVIANCYNPQIAAQFFNDS